MIADAAVLFAKAKRLVGRVRASEPSHAPTFTARLTRDEVDGGWIAECVEIPGAMSQGETRDEAIRNLIDAILDVMAVRMAQHAPHLDDRANGYTDEDREDVPLCV